MSIFGRLFACAKTRLSACIFSLLLQKSRSASPHVEGCCITVVHGWTGFYSATSLTFRQTRYQALYTDIQRLIADTASILCRVQRMPSMASAEHEFACRKLTALTGGQWFTAKSSLQCKLEVKECTGRTFFNDDIRVRSESAHPCIGFVSSFFHKLDNLKEDRLLEKGKHAELLEKTGYYTKLWNAQIEA